MPITKDAVTQLDVVPLWIDGQNTTASPPSQFPVIGFAQSTNNPVFLAEAANTTSATHAADSSWRAFQSWKHTPVAERRRIATRAAEILKSRINEVARVVHLETSASIQWGETNVLLAAEWAEELAASASSLKGELANISIPGSLALVVNEPVGPILAICPWNASLILSMRAVTSPIVAGCTVVLKASELCPRTHHFLAEIYQEAGLPAGVLNIIQATRENGPEVTEALIAHPSIRKIEFIGSAGVGRAIGGVAAKYLKPIIMELGGKSPAIVLDDADLKKAAEKCVTGGKYISSLLYVARLKAENIASQFIEYLKTAATEFPITPAVSERILNDARKKIVDAEGKGATFLLGSSNTNGCSLEPTILTGVTKEMDIFDEESFGPCFTVITCRDDAHAVELANDSAYGLNAAIHTRDMGRALDIAKQLEISQVHINQMTPYDAATLPVGGIKGSGWGRANGLWGLREYVYEKLITLNKDGASFA
ncbi:hypothetical protein FQN50_003238 [Emmonsiellopsis sp. PD_5]|nr:hypothetical protein FQN50_003238 [Emmonsiellopsis sp. PD_5]